MPTKGVDGNLHGSSIREHQNGYVYILVLNNGEEGQMVVTKRPSVQPRMLVTGGSQIWRLEDWQKLEEDERLNRFLVVRTRPAIWTSNLMRQKQDLETKKHVVGCLELHDEWTESELQETAEKLATICSERVFLEDLMRKASLVYRGYVKFVELQETYIQVFRDPISFDVDVSSVDGGNDSDGDDDNDQGNINKDLNDKEPLGSSLSFGFSKVSLDDFEKQPSGSGKSPKNQGDLFGQNLVTMEVLNQGPLTPDRMPTRASNTKSMFDGTLASVDDKWESFSNQVKAQFKGNEGGLALEGIDLAFFPNCNQGHFYVVVFSLTKTTSLTILDNSRETYDSKCKEVCDLLIKMFARHLKLYGHNWHAQVASLKHKIPKLKWSTKGNFHETPCGSTYWEPHVNVPMMILKIINHTINIFIPTFHTLNKL
nr:hypothetical protein [Tanacetum cinerariifolium]